MGSEREGHPARDAQSRTDANSLARKLPALPWRGSHVQRAQIRLVLGGSFFYLSETIATKLRCCQDGRESMGGLKAGGPLLPNNP